MAAFERDQPIIPPPPVPITNENINKVIRD